VLSVTVILEGKEFIDEPCEINENEKYGRPYRMSPTKTFCLIKKKAILVPNRK